LGAAIYKKEGNTMALIKCPECGKEISDKAEACISCGCPIDGNVRPAKSDKLRCPRCSGENITFEIIQSQDVHRGKSHGKSKEKSIVKPKGLIGHATFGLLGKKKVITKGRNKGKDRGRTEYKQETYALCSSCGHSWKK
jgi:uncharacterized C2H2 Zn-finger protein